ncbi:hypothetical protein PFY12_05170 [Chryseobacterium camelliae]|uniref:Uncharacterized protein n=1 Tax=Chryseobacterium camelliae TaxID=1265445 RepID=A0ABY7QQN9_9FLAO|nr:hypothetical protein [Chryseobacterium camelliae]WBV61513.1 hypothetical protein PFY12_05170 [Chryseobacterium camelliae]
MKTNILLLFLLVFGCISAQKKTVRPAVKTIKKEVQATVEKSLLYNLLGKNIDNALMELDEKMSGKGYIFSGVKDDKKYVYTTDKKKTEEVYSYNKYFTISKGDSPIQIFLGANPDKTIYDIYINYENPEDGEAFKKEIGVESWKLIETKGAQSIYKNKEKFAVVGSNNIAAFIPESKYEPGLEIAPVLAILNSAPICVKKKEVYSNEGRFIDYLQEFYYKNGFKITVDQELRKETTYIYNPSKIALHTVLSKLQDLGYKERYKEERTQHRYFYNESSNSMIKATDDYLELYSLPDPASAYNDSHLKQQAITPYLLNDIYQDFPDQTVREQYLKDHFWDKASSDGTLNIFGRDSNDNIVRVWFYDNENFDKTWGGKFNISFQDGKAMNSLQFDNTALFARNESSNEGYYKFSTYYYDKNKYTASKTSYDVQQNVNKLAEQKLEAERKQREIEENERKARKNAELQQGLQSFTNQLLELYKK